MQILIRTLIYTITLLLLSRSCAVALFTLLIWHKPSNKTIKDKYSKLIFTNPTCEKIAFLVTKYEHDTSRETDLVIIEPLIKAGYKIVPILPNNTSMRRLYLNMGFDKTHQATGIKSYVRTLLSKEKIQKILDCLTYRTTADRNKTIERYIIASKARELRLSASEAAIKMTFIERIVGLIKVTTIKGSLQFEQTSIENCILVLSDRGYLPGGPLFDAFIEAGKEVVTWNAAHSQNTFMLKRYTKHNKNKHPFSVCDLHDLAIKLPNEAARWRQFSYIHMQLYQDNKWYPINSLNSKNKTLPSVLDKRNKPVAIIFPHILYDATSFYDTDLFLDYKEWLQRTLKSASKNKHWHWMIKLHPAHLIKNARDNINQIPAEILIIKEARERYGLHIEIIPADTKCTTIDLILNTADVVLTVRGTVGLEASCYSVPAILGGSSRYSHLGFTCDFQSQKAYCEFVESFTLDDVPRLTKKQTDIARRLMLLMYHEKIYTPLHLELSYDASKNNFQKIKIKKGFFNQKDNKIDNFLRSQLLDYSSD
ncbi:hypothetical protein OAP54_04135 [Planktomarina temperata]|nr:hypothetical protein [Planktomarina temperata]